jgi:hypothetical protein
VAESSTVAVAVAAIRGRVFATMRGRIGVKSINSSFGPSIFNSVQSNFEILFKVILVRKTLEK